MERRGLDKLTGPWYHEVRQNMGRTRGPVERKYDLTKGNILRKLLLVAVPIMGTQLMQMAYNLVDIAYLGRVGSEAVAASSTAGFYLWMSNAFVMLGRRTGVPAWRIWEKARSHAASTPRSRT